MDDEPVHRLQAPLSRLKLAGQPVEQFRVGGSFAPGAEVFRGAHQAPPEVRLPNTVHRHPAREGIALVHQPAREGEAIRLMLLRQLVQRGRHAHGDHLSRLQEVAPGVEARHARLHPLLHHHGGDDFGFLLTQVSDLLGEVRPALVLGGEGLHLLVQFSDLLADLVPFGDLFRRAQVQVRLIRVVEEGEHPPVFFLGDGIVLVVVALGAADAQTQEHRARGADAIHHGFPAELLLVDAAFLVDHRVAMEPGGDLLRRGGVRQHVAGDLLDGELVKGLVRVERLDHPVAVLPDDARVVFFVAVRVRVTGGVQPPTRPVLAVLGRGQQPLHELPVGIRALVREEGVDFLDGGRQADQVQAHPTEERELVRAPGGLQPGPLQPRHHKLIDGVVDVFLRPHLGRRGPLDGLEGPVQRRGIDLRVRRVGALVDPRSQDGDCLGLQTVARRWHDPLRVLPSDESDQSALGALAGDDGRAGLPALEDGGAAVQPQAPLLIGGAVAGIARARQDRLHVPLEIDLPLQRLGAAALRAGDCQGRHGHADQTHQYQEGDSFHATHPVVNSTHPPTRRQRFGFAPG